MDLYLVFYFFGERAADQLANPRSLVKEISLLLIHKRYEPFTHPKKKVPLAVQTSLKNYLYFHLVKLSVHIIQMKPTKALVKNLKVGILNDI